MIIIGIIAGWIAEKLTRSDHGLLTNLLVGIVGALLGGWLADRMDIEFGGFWGVLVVAAVGATILLAILKAVRR
ncbi:Transglycosylase-associated protein [Lutibaculum baratangense AMV1]|uniref:Transglycosylase-associated protein n=2 Tax=Lutibaculum TaxID=1358438 RepID=V4R5I8_9HYPH|nr:Transglycosylase-associated protein [Lutibaculum baratangense AMV1]